MELFVMGKTACYRGLWRSSASMVILMMDEGITDSHEYSLDLELRLQFLQGQV
jgi:hypothetical protein